jgi:hypothetical protein
MMESLRDIFARQAVRDVRGGSKRVGWQAAVRRGLTRPTFASWPLGAFAFNPSEIKAGE